MVFTLVVNSTSSDASAASRHMISTLRKGLRVHTPTATAVHTRSRQASMVWVGHELGEVVSMPGLKSAYLWRSSCRSRYSSSWSKGVGEATRISCCLFRMMRWVMLREFRCT